MPREKLADTRPRPAVRKTSVAGRTGHLALGGAYLSPTPLDGPVRPPVAGLDARLAPGQQSLMQYRIRAFLSWWAGAGAWLRERARMRGHKDEAPAVWHPIDDWKREVDSDPGRRVFKNLDPIYARKSETLKDTLLGPEDSRMNAELIVKLLEDFAALSDSICHDPTSALAQDWAHARHYSNYRAMARMIMDCPLFVSAPKAAPPNDHTDESPETIESVGEPAPRPADQTSISLDNARTLTGLRGHLLNAAEICTPEHHLTHSRDVWFLKNRDALSFALGQIDALIDAAQNWRAIDKQTVQHGRNAIRVQIREFVNRVP